MRRFAIINSLVGLILVAAVQLSHSATVTYTLGDTSYYTNWNDGGGIFSNAGGAELGMWANQNAKQVVAWRTFKTAGNNTGSNRDLQIGDVFTIQVWANNSNSGGQIGFSLNDGGSTGSWANRYSGSRLYVQEDGTAGSWYVNNSSGNSSLDYNVSSTSRNYQFKVYITSQTTADVELIVDSTTTKRLYNVTMNGNAGENIDAWSIYRSDGSSDIYWKQTTTVEDLGSVNLGYYLTSGNFNPGVIDDGLAANSTTSVRVNNVNIGGDAGTVVILDDANTYTGNTTINAAATARIGANNGFGTAGTVSTTATGRILMSNGITVSRALTLNGDGTGSGALINESGNNTWSGNITLNTGSRISANSGTTLAISGTVSAGANTLYVGGAGNTTISTAVSGSKTTGDGALFKDGDGTLTLSANNSNLTGDVTIRAGTISVANANSLGSGGRIFLGTTNSTASANLTVTDNTTRTGSLNIMDASTGGVVEVASGKTFTISGVLDQNGGTSVDTRFEKRGAGTLKLSGGTAGTYNGQIRISNGTLVAGSSGSLGDNTSTATRALDLGINLSAQASANNVRLDLADGVTLNQSMYVGANQGGATRTLGIEGGTGSATFQNETYLDGNLTLDPGASGTLTVSGKITQNQNAGATTQGIIKSSAGTVVLSGANDYKGTTTIDAGTLKLERAGGPSITGSTIAVNAGTLLLGAANQIGSDTPITLNGGTLDTGGLADTVGKLKITAASTILGMDKVTAGSDDFLFSGIDLADYGTSGSQLTFRPTSNTTYQIGDVIRLSTSNYTGWTGYSTTSFNDFQNKVKFGDANLSGSISFGGGYTTLTVAAIPEPKVYMAAGALALLIAYAEVRRRKKIVSSKA